MSAVIDHAGALDALAPLFAYPDEAYAARAHEAATRTGDEGLAAFAAAVAALPVTSLQEAFVQAFDLNPAATLEVGWHLFGEQYERGAFLVDLRGQLREAGIAETGELPDHLLHVLPLVGAMPSADAAAFAARVLAPALERIAAALPAASPFAGLVLAARAALPGTGPGEERVS